MKKILSVATLFFILLTSCGSNDDGSSVAPLMTTITVGQQTLEPNRGIYANFEVDDTGRTGKTFKLNRTGTPPVDLEMVINVHYPASAGDGSGNYTFAFGGQQDLTASGYVHFDGESYLMTGGSLQYADLGDSKFKFVFSGTSLVNSNTGEVKTFGAAIEGEFSLLETDN